MGLYRRIRLGIFFFTPGDNEGERYDWEFHRSEGFFLESRAIGKYKYKVLSFIGLSEFNVWFVRGLCVGENMFICKGASLSAVVFSALFLPHFSSGRSSVIRATETPSCGC